MATMLRFEPLDAAIEEYVAVFSPDWKDKTLTKYRAEFRDLIAWLRPESRALTTESLDFATLLAYVAFLKGKPAVRGVWRGQASARARATSASTAPRRLNSVGASMRAIRAFVLSLFEDGRLTVNPFARKHRRGGQNPLIPRADTPTKSASLSDSEALECGCEGRERLDLRDQAIVSVLKTTSARNSSVRLVRLHDLDLSRNVIRFEFFNAKWSYLRGRPAERIEPWRPFAEPAVDSASVDWSRLAAMTARWSPADIRHGRRRARPRPSSLRVRHSHGRGGLAGSGSTGGSIEPEDDEPLPELPHVAIHEAGHVACAVALGLEVRSVHLVIGHRGGRTETGAEGRVMRAYDLEAGAVVALGGLAAEELLCENPTLGSVHDVREATELLLRRIEAGVDPEFASVSRKAWNPAFGVGPIDPLMAPRVLAGLSAARDQARAIVASQGASIETFAQELLGVSILTGERLTSALTRAGWPQT